MHINWQFVCISIERLSAYVWANRLPLLATAAMLLSAAVKTMPDEIPHTTQDWWTWFSGWAHQVFNTKTDRQAQQPGK